MGLEFNLITLKIIIILICIASVWYIDYQTMEIEKQAQEMQNYSAFESITQDELDFQRKKFEEKMKEYDKLLWH